MKKMTKLFTLLLLSSLLILSGCGASNTVKGGGIGGGAGAALGAGLGAIFGGKKGAAWGAGIGAAVGGTTGVIIGKKMDKQAAELAKIEGAKVEKINKGEGIKVTFESGILFSTNSSTLNSISQNSLNEFAASLINNPDTYIAISGHTDNTGSDAINNPLSEKRAQSVNNYLYSKGVSQDRMKSIGFGSTKPISDNSTAKGRSDNRRVEIVIVPNEKMIQDSKK